ncbi:hypothetical protein R82291_FJPPFKPJ_00688 [Fructobacillus cardui]|uniref:hypothetical protein n=1 Tax=Fructobacillus cardui TaxID=2893170 RepID=UPI00143739EA|nr:hypothetical protein [Fructobacillus cardui]MCK8627179.1 hypothetical protein [Fructobacillus cardui]QHJ83574.1 MAG: hypothetical protein [Caudoviricetes sp.]CAK1230318.1 hypothetical protein R82291_FJPPFKPJ_00688 [Fructobacillus cardui]
MIRFNVNTDSIIVDGFSLSNFVAGADPVSWAQDQDNAQVQQDAFGNGYVLDKNHTGGTITVRLIPGTPSFKKMMQLAGQRSTFGVMIKTSAERVGGTEAIIVRKPNGNVTENNPSREFQIKVIDYQYEAQD